MPKTKIVNIKKEQISWEKIPWYSSYEFNNYGKLFYSLVRIHKPNKIVELGTKAGYSSFHLASGLKDNGKGYLYCYDLWEKYPYNSVTKSIAENNLKNLSKYITLKQADAFKVHKLHKSVDILHIDLSNTGEILEKIISQWINKVKNLIIFEGGSKERDQVEWMIKYKKDPISNWIESFKTENNNFELLTIEPFPSITILKRKC